MRFVSLLSSRGRCCSSVSVAKMTVGLIGAIFALAGGISVFAARSATGVHMIHIDDMTVHDPFILADAKSNTYFMYAGEDPTDDAARPGTHHKAGVVAYISKDLVSWEGPKMVFEIPEGFWGDVDSSPWAPEVHAFDGRYYLFTTFNAWKQIMEIREDRPSITKRASQILVGDAPEGPFKPFGNHPTPPPGEMTLDATFWEEDGQPYIVYCHEWIQTTEGLIKALRLKTDLSETVGHPTNLLNAREFAWTAGNIEYRGQKWPGWVTDGPFLYRLKSGTLALLWSSHTPAHLYAQTVAYSRSGKLAGPWTHPAEPLLWDDRGHGMLFCAFDGRLLLVLHRYFHRPKTRVQIYEMEDAGDSIRVKGQILGTK